MSQTLFQSILTEKEQPRFYHKLGIILNEGSLTLRGRIGWAVWITGLPGSGKSSVTKALRRILKNYGVKAQVLSSDLMRRAVTPRPTYSLEERDLLYTVIANVAKLLTQNGINVMMDATGNLRRYRDQARKEIARFMEAYARCSLEFAIQRERERRHYSHAPKEIYRKAFDKESLRFLE